MIFLSKKEKNICSKEKKDDRKEIAVIVRYCCNGFHHYYYISGFPSGSMVKNLPAMQETWVQFLGQEDPLEEGESCGQRNLVGYDL